jgi:hypothetical protein
MKRSLIGIAIAGAAVGIFSPAQAQAPSPYVAQWQWPQTAYAGAYQPYYYFAAPTPSDAYRQGLINRWELEQFEGPTPQALQGPSPDGGNQGGSDDRGN